MLEALFAKPPHSGSLTPYTGAPPMSRLLSLAAALMLAGPAAADDAGFPAIVGTWAGTFLTGYTESIPNRANGLQRTEFELDVIKLDGNLITAKTRWRARESDDSTGDTGEAGWADYDAIGTFRLDEPTQFVLAQTGTRTDNISVGTYQGVYFDDVMMVTFVSAASGVSFAAQLVEKTDSPKTDSQ